MFPIKLSPVKFFLSGCAILLIASAFKVIGQAGVYIELQKPAQTINPKEFYVSRVDYERTDKSMIGTLLPAQIITGKPTEELKTELKGGAKKAITDFVAASLATDKSLRPIIIKIKNFKVIETAGASGRVDGRIAFAITFGYEQYDDFVKLGDYSTSSTYQRSFGPAQNIEPMLSSTLLNALTYLDKWMDKQAGTNIKLAKSVQLSFTDYNEKPEGDTIYYDVDRPLKWDDFQLKPQPSRYAAEVFASLGYTEEAKVENGIVKVKLRMKVYLPKSACWARAEAMNASSLLHEQHHFDIVKIVAERVKQRLLAERLEPANYDGPINVTYFDALREIDMLQKQYDGETAHSTNAYQQQQWNKRIDKELQQLGITRGSAQAAGRN
ncbi:DUF922 domain-containing protein [Mucilaginibacter pedocola]|uniref:DUF922 domain-containing protein n=1 Tax=Mucilaginibacter pedocola TaxID=1792845 RepID=A0A1S9PGR1_9SPHI|nr:hypothetical protein [Mucilaginibacter pedocola]OOQ60143.1 hypothetical protein BC343_26855 [Mucilaginibacter pedocola]